MAKGDDLEERLINFAVKILEYCSQLPKTQPGKHIASQLLRSGTSPAPNYAEARGAESKKDFEHKLGIVLKELKESEVWLKIVKRSKTFKIKDTDIVTKECDELSRIIGKSIKTSKSH